jgi:hypothetical protein
MGTFESLIALDDSLVAAGHHGLTPYWREVLRRWYGHETATSLVARVGRGGAKSHTAIKIALNEVIYGPDTPLGETHYWACVSENMGEARQRLNLFESFCKALGVPYERSGDEIVLPALRRGLRVFSCTIGAVSGFRCIGYSCDEVAKWSNADHSANPAPEVVASLDFMTITHPTARDVLISSPLSRLDYHYTRFEQGENEQQLITWAAAWDANPAITREMCWKRARGDKRIFEREGEGLPSSQLASMFDAADIARALEGGRTYLGHHGARPVCCLDPSSLRGGDGFAKCIVSWAVPTIHKPVDEWGYPIPHITVQDEPNYDPRTGEHKYRYYLCGTDGAPLLNPDNSYAKELLAPKSFRPVLVVHAMSSLDQIQGEERPVTTQLYRIKNECQDRSVIQCFTDQHLREMVIENLGVNSPIRVHGIPFEPANKKWAVFRLQSLLREGCVDFSELPPDEKEALRRELLSFAEICTLSGTFKYAGRGSAHDDRVSVLLMAMLADLAGEIDGSPVHRLEMSAHEAIGSYRYEIGAQAHHGG